MYGRKSEPTLYILRDIEIMHRGAPPLLPRESDIRVTLQTA